jgi:hypothetical protein
MHRRVRVLLQRGVPLGGGRVGEGDDLGTFAGPVGVLRDAASGTESHHTEPKISHIEATPAHSCL